MKKVITAALLLIAMHTSLFAGDPAAGIMFVTGTVTDKTSNESLAGVEVRVKGTSIVTYTDFDGNYYLPELPAGTYTLEFSCITYNAVSVITDGSDLEPELNIALQQR